MEGRQKENYLFEINRENHEIKSYFNSIDGQTALDDNSKEKVIRFISRELNRYTLFAEQWYYTIKLTSGEDNKEHVFQT